ncbi:uncharacterized protein ACOB8E_003342 isoform 1-T1 [Sarcophilus harrisii]
MQKRNFSTELINQVSRAACEGPGSLKALANDLRTRGHEPILTLSWCTALSMDQCLVSAILVSNFPSNFYQTVSSYPKLGSLGLSKTRLLYLLTVLSLEPNLFH